MEKPLSFRFISKLCSLSWGKQLTYCLKRATGPSPFRHNQVTFPGRTRKGFTIAEVIVSVFVFGIVLVGMVNAFKETFGVLNYISESINGSYLAKNGIEEVVATRNLCLSQYQSLGWSKFVETYASGSFVLSPVRTQCEFSMSGIVDKPASYEGPLNAFGDVTSAKNGVHYLRKINTFPDSTVFYLKSINRTLSGSTDVLRLDFSKNIYSERNMLFSVPKNFPTGSLAKIESPYGSLYNIDGSSNSGNFSNLGKSTLKFSKILSYSGVTSVADGDVVQVTGPLGDIVTYEFDTNGTLTSPSNIAVDATSGDMDTIQNLLCRRINELEGVECRMNKIFPGNISEKLFGTIDTPSVTFGSGYTLALSGSTMTITLGTGTNIPTIQTNQYINPSYLVRSNGASAALNLQNDQSDTTAGKGILIPDRPIVSGNSNIGVGYPSLLNVKISIFMYDGDSFVEESNLTMKLGDIGRFSY